MPADIRPEGVSPVVSGLGCGTIELKSALISVTKVHVDPCRGQNPLVLPDAEADALTAELPPSARQVPQARNVAAAAVNADFLMKVLLPGCIELFIVVVGGRLLNTAINFQFSSLSRIAFGRCRQVFS